MSIKQPTEGDRQLLTDTAVQVNLLASHFREIAEDLDKMANGEPTKRTLSQLYSGAMKLVQAAKEVQTFIYLIALADLTKGAPTHPTSNQKD